MSKLGLISWFVALSVLTGHAKMTEWDGMSALPADLESPMRLTVTVGGEDITELQGHELEQAVERAIHKQNSRLVNIRCGSANFEKSREELGLKLSHEWEWLIEDIIRFRESYLLMEATSGGDLAISYDYSLPLVYEEGLLDSWIRAIKKEVDVPLVEHGLVLKNGQFTETTGNPGMEVSKEALKNQLLKALNAPGDEPILIDVCKKEVHPVRDRQLLQTVNARISGFSSYFPLYQAGRTENVRIAAKRIDKTVLMPGEEFSYAEQVSPVTSDAGYQHATIFMNGQPVSGIGGGICQVSSTMYNTELKAGIVPTQRRNHSLIVDYVPRGQDATMAEGYIDYCFVNTLDYPIYIHATTDGGTLTIEFWSNDQALNGITYLPRTVFKGLTEDGQRKYDTTLYGYNRKGELIYEEFLHRSFYKQKN